MLGRRLAAPDFPNEISVSEVLIILAMPRSLSRSCGGGLGWGQTRVVCMLRHPHPTLPRKRERE